MIAQGKARMGWRAGKSSAIAIALSCLASMGLSSDGGPARQALPLAPVSTGTPYRAFSVRSEWNKTLPRRAPISAKSKHIIGELKSFDSSIQYPKLAAGLWADPVYFAHSGDPVYTIYPRDFGPTLSKVHIPLGARPADNSDGHMVVFDRIRGVVFELLHAAYDSTGRSWSADGTALYSLSSNGLACTLPESNRSCPMNSGHRGIPPAIHAVRYKEVRAGAIRHVLKISLDKTGECRVYPASDYEDGQGGSICEGTILRIKPGVDLRRRHLSYGCRVIAVALKWYGAVVGDTGGVPMEIKLENLQIEGRAQRWSTLGVTASCFRGKLSFNDFVAIRLGYHRP